MTRRPRAAAALVAVVFLALHLPYLPASLEDLDSINFALGLRHYDVAQHQPHPPGYPVFIALARLFRYATSTEAHALAALGIVAGALGVNALFAFFSGIETIAERRTHRFPSENRIDPLPNRVATDLRVAPTITGGPWIAWASMLVAITSPLYWFTAARPLSDTTGLAAALGVQAWTMLATTPWSFTAAAFAGGLAAGIRSQVVWLTVPLLAFVGVQRARATGSSQQKPVVHVVGASLWSWLWPFAIGCLVWAIPMVIVTGGPTAYWWALFSQGAEDLSGIQMLWTTPTPRELASALYYAFVAPWALWSVAIVVIVFAALGAALMARYWRSAATTLAVAYLPYFLFDILFQETFTTRYALPLIVPMAYLAVRGAAAFGWRAGVAVAIVVSLYDAHIGGTSIAAVAREKAPAFRMLDDMAAASSTATPHPVLAMDRREQFDLRRPLVWVDGKMPILDRRLPSPPQHEWLELVKYWNGGGRNPVWFVADPLRTDIDLVQQTDPIEYRWSMPYPILLGGVRPNEMDWYRIDRPDWYVGSGWALTPEAAGVSQMDRRSLSSGGIEGWVSTPVLTGGAALVLGGRNFEPTTRPRVRLAWRSHVLGEWSVQPGFFLETIRLPVISHEPIPDYQPVTITATPQGAIAIEQFDIALRTRVVFGYGTGWNEHEYNPVTGKRWRWLSERGELQVLGNGRPVRLHIEGESPRKYFSKPSRLTVKVGSTVAFDDAFSTDFAIDVTIPAEFFQELARPTTIVLETDQTYVPAERSSRSHDQRHLGLRIFECEVNAVS